MKRERNDTRRLIEQADGSLKVSNYRLPNSTLSASETSGNVQRMLPAAIKLIAFSEKKKHHRFINFSFV